jgi:hypothetical protein
MSERSKLLQSRNHWKQKAIDRGKAERAQRKEIHRIKIQRDRLKNEVKATKTELEKQSAAAVACVQNKTDLVYLSLRLFLFARIGFRAIARVLDVLGVQFGIAKAPCPQTISNWVTRLSIAKVQTLAQSIGRGIAKNHVWLIDLSIGLGVGKILSVLALDLEHHQQHDHAPGLADVQCVAIAVADSWTGEKIADFLRRVMANVGYPSAFLKDGGTDLQKAVGILNEEGAACENIADISHYIANLFKREYGDHALFDTFLSACGQASKRLKQTLLACLAPPKVSTKARFMNLHRLVQWADQLLKHLPPGRAAENSMAAKLRESLDQLPDCKAFIKRFLRDATPLLECQKILKRKGLNRETYAQCEKLLEVIPPSSSIRTGFTDWMTEHLAIANTLQLDRTGLPISTDVLESLFGVGKRFGTGQMKDANRIASRLPALCGTFTKDNVQDVLNISVARQKEVVECVDSLIKQRRNVLPNPGILETLAHSPGQRNFELIPSPGLWSTLSGNAMDDLSNRVLLTINAHESFSVTTVA